MTENSKNKVQNLAYTVAGGVIVGIILLVAQSFTSNTKEVEIKLNQLDKTKAPYTYVDTKVQNIEHKVEKNKDDILIEIRDLNKKNDEIYRILIEMNKK